MDYGPFKDRKKSVFNTMSTSSVEYTRYYSGNYEKTLTTVGTQEMHYIPCGNGIQVMYVKEGGVGSYYFPHTDYLGSILCVTDINRNVVALENYDAWGRDRNPTDWSYTASAAPRPAWLYRGFTSHEHLRDFTLINMNSRMYDPEVGRMLAVDNYVNSPYSSQSYNRYTYANNNPLIYTDPDGETPLHVAAAIIGGGFNLWSNWDKVDGFGSGLAYFGSGAIGGALAVGNPYAGYAFTASANVAVDIATGNVPDMSDGWEATKYVASTALSGFNAVGGAQFARLGGVALGKMGISYSTFAIGASSTSGSFMGTKKLSRGYWN